MIAQAKSFLEALKDMNSGVFDKTNNGECTQCGACCSNFLPMSKKEIVEIKKYVKKKNIKAYKHLIPVSDHVIDMTCPFMDDSKSKEKCRIYSVRPEICKQFTCCPNKRKPFNAKFKGYQIVNVRQVFFE